MQKCMVLIFLDPRFNSKSNFWKDTDERDLVKKLLIEKVENIIVQDALEEHRSRTLEIISNENKNGIENGNYIFEENERAFDLFGEKETSEIDIEATIKEKSKVQAEREVSLYLTDTESLTFPKEQTNPLEWWKKISMYILM